MSLSIFTNQLLDFSTKLHEMYPKDEQIFKFMTTVTLLKKTNPRKLLEFFSYYIYPYKNEIMNENDSFFKTIDYSKLASNKYKQIDSIVEVVSKYWDDMENTTKQNIWQYYKILIFLKEQFDQTDTKPRQ